MSCSALAGVAEPGEQQARERGGDEVQDELCVRRVVEDGALRPEPVAQGVVVDEVAPCAGRARLRRMWSNGRGRWLPGRVGSRGAGEVHPRSVHR